jgi:uncharacterized protein YcfJ
MNARFGPRRALTAAAMMLGAVALPAYGDSFTQWAPVMRVTPVYTQRTAPQQQCWVERVTSDEYVDQRGVPLDLAADGISGGVLGGERRVVVSGAFSGTAVGDAIDLERAGVTVAPVTRDVERCRTVQSVTDVVTGYDVTYRYQNRDVTTRMAYDPGRQVQVRVDVAPTVR